MIQLAVWMCSGISDWLSSLLPERQPTWIRGLDGGWYRPGDPRIAMRPKDDGTTREVKPIKRIECTHCGHVLHISPQKRQRLRGQVMACPSCGVEKRFRP